MKFAAFFSVLATVATVNALSECILSCQESEATASGCSSNYNTTLCYCSSDFATNVKACLYQNDCSSDVQTFYSNVDEFCDGEEETSSSSSSSETISDTDGTLGSCVLGCQASAATEAGCSSNYNETSCFCDNDDFALDVKACLYQNCSDYVSVFYNYRSDVCGTENSTEYKSSFSTTSSASAATATSTSTTEAISAASSSSGLTAGVKAGISVGAIVGGALIAGALAFAVLRRRKAAAAKDAEAARPPVKEIGDNSSLTSADTAHH